MTMRNWSRWRAPRSCWANSSLRGDRWSSFLLPYHSKKTNVSTSLPPAVFLTVLFLLQCWWGAQEVFSAQVPQATAPTKEEETRRQRCALRLPQCKQCFTACSDTQSETQSPVSWSLLLCFTETTQGHPPQTHWPHGDLVFCAREHHQWHAGSPQRKIYQAHIHPPPQHVSQCTHRLIDSSVFSPSPLPPLPSLCRRIPSTHQSMPRWWRTTIRSSRGPWTCRRWGRMYGSECTHLGRSSAKQWKLSSKTAPPTMVMS